MTSTPSVQLYSVRDAIAADLPDAIARIARIGFTQVEVYGFVDQAEQYRAAFAEHGIVPTSGHAPVIDSADPTAAFEAAVLLGMSTVIDPFIPSDRWQTRDDAVRIAERVNELAEQAAGYGLAFGYHNHQWEFANHADGLPVFDHFVAALSPKPVLEVDTFWATVGGADTPAVLRSLGDRVRLIHVKDGTIAGDIATALPSNESALVVPEALARAFAEQVPAGEGDVDVPAILAAAPQATRVIEFDGYSGDVFEAIAASYRWLQENDSAS